MAGQIKINGTWHKTPGLLAKINGSWHASTTAFIKVSGTWRQWFTQVMLDTFTRTTSGTLGTSDAGVLWQDVVAGWFANGSQAQSSQSNGNTTIAVLPFTVPDVLLSAQVTAGTGLAFWVQDYQNWWGVIPYVTTSTSTYTYNCSSCYQCTQSGCSSYNCLISAAVAPRADTMNCACGNGGQQVISYYSAACCSCCASGNACLGCSGSGANRVCTCESISRSVDTMNCACGNATAGSPAVYGCCGYSYVTTCCSSSTCTGTQTNYNYYLRLQSSVNGNESFTQDLYLGTDTTGAGLPQYIQVSTSGNTITAQAYSDALSTTQGSALVYTASGATKANNHGIIQRYSPALQGNTLDNFLAGV